LALISTVYGRTLEWGLVENNPARGIRRNPEQSRDRFLQSNELPRFFATCPVSISASRNSASGCHSPAKSVSGRDAKF
jgi:hypothetical protein